MPNWKEIACKTDEVDTEEKGKMCLCFFLKASCLTFVKPSTFAQRWQEPGVL